MLKDRPSLDESPDRRARTVAIIWLWRVVLVGELGRVICHENDFEPRGSAAGRRDILGDELLCRACC